MIAQILKHHLVSYQNISPFIFLQSFEQTITNSLSHFATFRFGFCFLRKFMHKNWYILVAHVNVRCSIWCFWYQLSARFIAYNFWLNSKGEKKRIDPLVVYTTIVKYFSSVIIVFVSLFFDFIGLFWWFFAIFFVCVAFNFFSFHFCHNLIRWRLHISGMDDTQRLPTAYAWFGDLNWFGDGPFSWSFQQWGHADLTIVIQTADHWAIFSEIECGIFCYRHTNRSIHSNKYWNRLMGHNLIVICDWSFVSLIWRFWICNGSWSYFPVEILGNKRILIVIFFT